MLTVTATSLSLSECIRMLMPLIDLYGLVAISGQRMITAGQEGEWSVTATVDTATADYNKKEETAPTSGSLPCQLIDEASKYLP